MDDDRQLIPRSSYGIVDPHAGADYGEGGFNRVDDDLSIASNGGGHAPEIGPIITIPGDREGPSEAEPARQFFIHAPHYHWHQHGMADPLARAAIEAIDGQAYRFGRYIEGQIQALGHNADGFYANQTYLKDRLEEEQGRVA